MQHFGTAMPPASPLPDSTALESGIIEDERPSRLSRVQDNVRNLLWTSVFGSVASSPTTPVHARPQVSASASSPTLPTLRPIQVDEPLRSNPPSPVLRSTRHPAHTRFPVRASPSRPEVLPSPTDSATSVNTDRSPHIDSFPCPPSSYQRNVQQMAHQSALFDTRAMAALNHPDLSHPSVTDLSQQKSQHRRQHGGWERHRTGSHGSGSAHRRHKRRAHRAGGSTGLLCFMSAILLAALVATYVSLAMTVDGITTTFHVLFILGILLATIVFSHALIRFLLYSKRRNRNLPTFVRVTRQGHQRRHRHHHHHRDHLHPHVRRLPTVTGEHEEAFVPSSPIEVHVPSDEVRADSDVADLAIATHRPLDWDKDVPKIANPPPAYGRWRDSVRANPDLLHWAPSPISPDTPALPSPTYEEATAASSSETHSSPPSYRTRESPARQREMLAARAGIAQPLPAEPEMFEVRGINSPGAGAGPRVGEAF
ncbi:hypothetical protein Slin14017_G101540 [Septoria linicola]|nr:hypothetical protein Slin14017_G101540 [Septoria linicola]